MEHLISRLAEVTLVLAAISSINGQKDGDVKFLNYGQLSESRYEGIVQVYKNEQWGGICHENFDMEAATVACRQLGYKMATRKVNADDEFSGHDNQVVSINSVVCRGSESTLADCTITWNSGGASCDEDDVAAIACSLITDYSVRLMGGTSWFEGRVEVYHGGSHDHWGTICNDYWGKSDAQVVCRQLNYGNPDSARYRDGDIYKPGSAGMPVLLDNVFCEGSESTLASCTTNGWHVENCWGNEELAAVICEPADETGELTTAAIAGIVVASLFVVCCVIAVIFICYRQSKSKKRRSREAPSAVINPSGGVTYINPGAGPGGTTVAFITPGQRQQVAPVAPPPYTPAPDNEGV